MSNSGFQAQPMTQLLARGRWVSSGIQHIFQAKIS